MKKFLFILFLILLVATAAYSQVWQFQQNGKTFTSLQTLSTGTTNTGTVGTAVSLGMPFETITCVLTQGTNTATSITFDLEGSLDGTNYKLLKAITATSFPDIQTTNAATSIPVLYMRATYSARTAGHSTTAPALNCIASH